MLRILCRQSRSTLSSISFARSACSYCCNPRPWIQAPMSTRSSRCGHIYVSLPYPRLFPRANRETAEMGRRRSSSAIPCRKCVKLLPEPAEFWISNRDVALLQCCGAVTSRRVAPSTRKLSSRKRELTVRHDDSVAALYCVVLKQPHSRHQNPTLR